MNTKRNLREPREAPANGREGAPIRVEAAPAVTVSDSGPLAFYLDSGKFAQMWRAAQLFSRSDLVPPHFRGHPENCFIAAEMASRFDLTPAQVMQGMYVISGKPGMEAKLVIGIINRSGLYRGPLKFEMIGEKGKDSWGCFCWAADRESGERITGPEVTMGMARAEGWLGKRDSKWQTMPELMLRYRAAAFFGRLVCPEVTLGMQTREELIDFAPLGPAQPDLPTSTETDKRLLEAPDQATSLRQRIAQLESRAGPGDPGHPDLEMEHGEAQAPASSLFSLAEECPAELPLAARADSTFIDHAVAVCRPSKLTAHAARKIFHVLHAPHSWEKCPPEVQDRLYSALIGQKIDFDFGGIL